MRSESAQYGSQSAGRQRTALLAAAAATLLAGCATFSADGGFGAVKPVAAQRLGKELQWAKSDRDRDAIRQAVRERLLQPLSLDDAVQVALLNNRGLQATYAELGIAEADLVQAGRLSNPSFMFNRTTGSGATVIGRAWIVNVLSWVTMPISRRIETRHFEQAKLLVANEALSVALDTQEAYVRAVAAQQSVHYFEQVKIAAEAGADLAARMARAGNWSKLDQLREQVFYADAIAQLARAQQTFVAERENLTRLMGLWGRDVEFKLQDRLPELPAGPANLQDLESFALAQRLDLQAAKQETEGLATSLGLTKATRIVNVLDIGYLNNTEPPDNPHQRGYEITVNVPLFDWGSARVAKAQAIYMQAVDRYASLAINARSQVRESYLGYRTAYDVAKHYRDEVVPLRKQIAEESLLRYNGMLLSAFELLADSREQVTAVNAYIGALQDYWLAETELAKALGGRLPPTALSFNAPARASPATAGQAQVALASPLPESLRVPIP